jgi:hypothetical protein
MGSRAKFQQFFEANSGVYYRSVGWVERGEEVNQQLIGLGLNNLEALIERYGESNGRYVYEECMKYVKAYSKVIFIETGLEAGPSFVARALAEANEKKWEFEKIKGDLRLFHRLLAGDWNDDFLIVPPGHWTVASYDKNIITAIVSPASPAEAK